MVWYGDKQPQTADMNNTPCCQVLNLANQFTLQFTLHFLHGCFPRQKQEAHAWSSAMHNGVCSPERGTAISPPT
jgi:hypothetical protein